MFNQPTRPPAEQRGEKMTCVNVKRHHPPQKSAFLCETSVEMSWIQMWVDKQTATHLLHRIIPPRQCDGAGVCL